jgi:hypothetical protein
MKLIDLDMTIDYDVAIRAQCGYYTGGGADKSVYITDLIRGISGVMNCTVYKIEIDPERCTAYAYIDLPAEMANALHKYNAKYYK